MSSQKGGFCRGILPVMWSSITKPNNEHHSNKQYSINIYCAMNWSLLFNKKPFSCFTYFLMHAMRQGCSCTNAKLIRSSSYICCLFLECSASYRFTKLDGVGPVDNRPSTNKLHHLIFKKNTCDTWHVTRDMWHMTCDTWHVTHDTWHVKRLGGWTFSQNFSSLALTVCDLWYYEDLEEKDEWLN